MVAIYFAEVPTDDCIAWSIREHLSHAWCVYRFIRELRSPISCRACAFTHPRERVLGQKSREALFRVKFRAEEVQCSNPIDIASTVPSQ